MLHKHLVNYAIADGDKAFDCVQVKEPNVVIQLDYQDIVATDVTVELEQAVTAQSKFDAVESSLFTLYPGKTSHSWNLSGFAIGLFLRVVVRKGTAVAGTINFIHILY